jgi:hypothetical protein
VDLAEKREKCEYTFLCHLRCHALFVPCPGVNSKPVGFFGRADEGTLRYRFEI